MFLSPGVEGSELHVDLHNVVQTPVCDLRKENHLQVWKYTRDAPGNWVQRSTVIEGGPKGNRWTWGPMPHNDSFIRSIPLWFCTASVLEVSNTRGIAFLGPDPGPIQFANHHMSSIARPVSVRKECGCQLPRQLLGLFFPTPGLWAELSGRHISFVYPRDTVRGVDDPTPILQYWDTAVKHIYDLRGRSLQQTRRQVIVFDEQPSLGQFWNCLSLTVL